MQNQWLSHYSSDQFRVYAVWLPILWSDATDKWDGEHFIGQWFAKQVDGYDGVSWDMYYLCGPEAVWKTVPSALVGSGGTIYAERENLETELHMLLGR